MSNTRKDDDLISVLTHATATSKLKATKIDKPSTVKTDRSYKEKLIGIINNMDDETIEKIGKEISVHGDAEVDLENIEEERDEVKDLDDKSVATENMYGQDIQQARQELDVKSVYSQRTVSSSKTVISKLEKDLMSEKKAREKLQLEIEELKKMNSDLCNAILSSTESTHK